MPLIIYGDFNCPYSCLASQRADQLMRSGLAQIEWRAVEHDRGLPHSGRPSAADHADWDRELAEVNALALPGEHPPAHPPPLISNTGAAVAAYAEAVTDGIQDELRRRLFHAIWADGQHLSGAYEVRRLLTAILWPAAPITPSLAAPELPRPLNRLTRVADTVRRSGGTIAPDGGPLTAAGSVRIQRWRAQWQALADGVVPAVIAEDGTAHAGLAGLAYLASLAGVEDPAGVESLAGVERLAGVESLAGGQPGPAAAA